MLSSRYDVRRCVTVALAKNVRVCMDFSQVDYYFRVVFLAICMAGLMNLSRFSEFVLKGGKVGLEDRKNSKQ